MKNEYSTKQRELILKFLSESSTHLTATDIARGLRAQGEHIGNATIYRTLEKFVGDGIVRKMIIDERSGACYQYISEHACSNHFHLKCIKCGRLIHLSCEFLSQLENHIFEHHQFVVSSGKTVIYGLCSSCGSNAK